MFETIEKEILASQKETKKILIIGLGQIGYSNAEYMTKLGLHVEGLDINKEAIHRALQHNVIQKEATNFYGYDYYIICISTHNPENMFMPFLEGIYSIVKRISKEGKTGALVGIDSTITRGTSKKLESILGHRLHVVHVPHRFYIHEKETHGVNQPRVVGGCRPCCTEAAFGFYQKMLKIPLQTVNSVEIAEMTKIVENSYRFMEIAFAEELKIICDRTNIDFEGLRQAVNSKWNINVLEAKEGIGGHCLPKDSQMLLNISNEILPYSIIETAKKIDSNYRLHKNPKLEIQ
ncbi:MAG: potassium transporter TrkA [Nitrosopumilus sp.]|nr:potassium transporter TrkA [Nitrosopumilus sp.]